MLNDYADIRALIKVEPLWFDTYGVPRYSDFSPDMLGVYWEEAVLFQIACQECSQYFHVSLEQTNMDLFVRKQISLSEHVKNKTLQYGDPPRHRGDTCVAGDTMTSVSIRTIIFYKREKQLSFDQNILRVPELELVDLYPNYEDKDERS